MQVYFGQCQGPLLIIHGGAGPQDPKSALLEEATTLLKEIARRSVAVLQKRSARDALVHALSSMEDADIFNAGRGAALQADGLARLTAAVMQGAGQRFAGIMNTPYVKNPSKIADILLDERARVLAPPGSEFYARKLLEPVEFNLTRPRAERWLKRLGEAPGQWDTVGCVIRDASSALWAGTSTGGRGFECPGRISDSGTVAGTYASSAAAFSATGIGEEIVDDALCARLETRVRDGLTLSEANSKAFAEAKDRSRQYGWIGLDANDGWVASHTTPTMSYVVVDGSGTIHASS